MQLNSHRLAEKGEALVNAGLNVFVMPVDGLVLQDVHLQVVLLF